MKFASPRAGGVPAIDHAALSRHDTSINLRQTRSEKLYDVIVEHTDNSAAHSKGVSLDSDEPALLALDTEQGEKVGGDESQSVLYAEGIGDQVVVPERVEAGVSGSVVGRMSKTDNDSLRS